MANDNHISERRRQLFLREVRFAQLEERTAKEEGERNYWNGYQRGLRRGFYGDWFGSAEGHARWACYVNEPNPVRRRLGEGYLDGLRRGQVLRGVSS